jgi:O-antigen/teichoic acid export membrane protein
MKENKSVKKNYIYNLILTFLNLFFPLMTSPYVSKVLGANNIGKVNYAMAVSNWFILIASFGIPTYGIREIARTKNNKEELSKTFWDLLIIKGIFTLGVLIIYSCLIIIVPGFYSEFKLFSLMNLLIILNIFTIDWFYQGIEEYSFITIRSIIIKIFSLVLIFFMIKQRNDYTIYAFITIFATAFSNVLNYLHSKKYVDYIRHKIRFRKYISELKVFFLSTLVISVYSQLDQVILGSLSSAKELAFYVRSKQITSIGMSLALFRTIFTFLFINDNLPGYNNMTSYPLAT